MSTLRHRDLRAGFELLHAVGEAGDGADAPARTATLKRAQVVQMAAQQPK